MEFILPFQIKPSIEKISYKDKILFIGSCFTEEIGKKMSELKFNVAQNPNGILYDPESICFALNSYIENKIYKEHDIFSLNELWHSWKHHSVFSGIHKNEVLQNINRSQSDANDFLKNASWLVITLGSSFNYILKEQSLSVANCHKASASLFDKKLISIEKIIEQLSETIDKFQRFNAGIKIIFTVSPVRHSRDGLIENNRSKARLIESVHEITEKFQNVFYFPAYELVIDVLRDYRFYKNDFVHPSETAIEYVFESFSNAYFDEISQKLSEEIKQVLSAMNHKPFQKESEAYKKFRRTQLGKINSIKERFQQLNFSSEEDFFSGDYSS